MGVDLTSDEILEFGAEDHDPALVNGFTVQPPVDIPQNEKIEEKKEIVSIEQPPEVQKEETQAKISISRPLVSADYSSDPETMDE